MNVLNRRQAHVILKDLSKKMIFLVGPRQVGKTWLARNIGQKFKNVVYLNYDRLEDQKTILSEAWPHSTKLLILDELHKMSNWKNYIKGVYDTKSSSLQILVTGSARLDVFRQVGDSLAGRYFLHHLFPFSIAELRGTEYESDLDRLLERGGFPEPFLAEDLIDVKRWRNQYIDSLIRSDIFEFDNVKSMKAIQLAFELLRKKVGSPISFKSIAEDVGVSPNTVKKYIQIFEALYIIFRVTPYSKNIARSLLKEPKIYFFDTGLVDGDIGAKFENLMAVSLLKDITGKIDQHGENYRLQYLRTKEGLEVDFSIIHDDNIELLIEAKNSDSDLSRSLLSFHKKYHLPAVQVVRELKHEKQIGDIKVRRAIGFLQELEF